MKVTASDPRVIPVKGKTRKSKMILGSDSHKSIYIEKCGFAPRKMNVNCFLNSQYVRTDALGYRMVSGMTRRIGADDKGTHLTSTHKILGGIS